MISQTAIAPTGAGTCPRNRSVQSIRRSRLKPDLEPVPCQAKTDDDTTIKITESPRSPPESTPHTKWLDYLFSQGYRNQSQTCIDSPYLWNTL